MKLKIWKASSIVVATATSLGFFSVSTTSASETYCEMPFSPTGDIFSLKYHQPKIVGSVNYKGHNAIGKGVILATNSVIVAPQQIQLLDSAELVDQDGRAFAKNVPVDSDSVVDIWSDQFDERFCITHWQNGLFGGATGDGHVRWVCFKDEDADGKFDQAWRVKGGNGVFLPLKPQFSSKLQEPDLSADRAVRIVKQVRIKKIKKDTVTLQVREGMDGRLRKTNEETIRLDGNVSTQFEGLELLISRSGKKKLNVLVKGSLSAPKVELTCSDTRVKFAGSTISRYFGFPSW